MKLSKVLFALVIAATVSFVSCKPKDSDIQAAVEKALTANPDFAKATVAVADGVATISGEVKDDATKTAIEAAVKAVKGVKSFVNNTTVPPPPPAPVVITQDDPLTQGVKDAIKDIPGITATVEDGVVKVAGTISKDKWTMLRKAIDALSPKKVDGTGLTIK